MKKRTWLEYPNFGGTAKLLYVYTGGVDNSAAAVKGIPVITPCWGFCYKIKELWQDSWAKNIMKDSTILSLSFLTR